MKRKMMAIGLMMVMLLAGSAFAADKSRDRTRLRDRERTSYQNPVKEQEKTQEQKRTREQDQVRKRLEDGSGRTTSTK